MSIRGLQRSVAYKGMTPVCGNCAHEKREANERKGHPDRVCGKYGFFVRMSGTCESHTYRERGDVNGTAQR